MPEDADRPERIDTDTEGDQADETLPDDVADETLPDDVADETLPDDVADEAARLTRLARRTDGEEADAYLDDREELLAEYSYTARVREEDDTLVCYPVEWVVDGTVRTGRIEDVDRGIERSLSGVGSSGDWEDVREHNAALADRVAADHGKLHGANADYLAEYASNHYAKRVESLTEAELAEFLTEYYPRNAWPTDDQKAVVEESIRRVFETADARPE